MTIRVNNKNRLSMHNVQSGFATAIIRHKNMINRSGHTVSSVNKVNSEEKVVLHLRPLRRIITFGNFGGRASDNVDSRAGGILFYPSELSCQFDIKKVLSDCRAPSFKGIYSESLNDKLSSIHIILPAFFCRYGYRCRRPWAFRLGGCPKLCTIRYRWPRCRPFRFPRMHGALSRL